MHFHTIHTSQYYLVNGLSLYRLCAAPVLLLLLFGGYENLFKWLLLLSFLTDAIDGFLARRFHVETIMGARLDSAADDLTMVVGIVGLVYLHPLFIREQLPAMILLLLLYGIQTAMALYKYRRLTSFHTWLAKLAALAQGLFLLQVFFMGRPMDWLFAITVMFTVADLVEEISITLMLDKWKADVKGIWWLDQETKTDQKQARIDNRH